MSSLFSKALVYLGLVDEDHPGGGDYEYEAPAPADDQRTLRPVATAAPEGRRVEPPASSSRVAPMAEPRIVGRVESATASERPRTSLRSSTGNPNRSISTSAQASVLVIEEFGDAKILADWTQDGVPVVMDLRLADSDLTRRVVDFSSGLIYALDGKMRKVGSGLVLVTPSGVELSDDEKQRLADLGVYQDLD